MLPLEGVRVVEFAHMVMGPSCGVVLADLGAEVIKVEPLKGDNTRRLEHAGSGFFPVFNRNKKSLAVDLQHEEGRKIVHRLLASADVLTENFRPGALDKLGFSYARLREDNPGLIYCSLKGFLHGPYEHRPALDEVTQMMGGLAYMTGLPDRPLRAGSSVVDIMGGTFAAVGILAALRSRESTGRGTQVTSALFESTAYLVAQHMAQFELTGEAPPPMSVKRPAWGVYDIFETAGGGRLFIGVVTDTQWLAFCREFQLDDLAADPRLKTNGQRVKERAWLVPRINQITQQPSPGRARGQARGDRHAVCADRQTLGPARRSAPQRLGRPAGDAGRRQDDSRAGAAGGARRAAARQAYRPAARRRAHAGIAGPARLFTPGNRKPARPRYSRAPQSSSTTEEEP